MNDSSRSHLGMKKIETIDRPHLQGLSNNIKIQNKDIRKKTDICPYKTNDWKRLRPLTDPIYRVQVTILRFRTRASRKRLTFVLAYPMNDSSRYEKD